MHPLRHTFRLGAIAAAAALLVACGGGDDTAHMPAEPTALHVGDSYSVEVQVGDQPASSESFRVYGITKAFDLVTTDTGNLIDGALVPLPQAAQSKQTAVSSGDDVAHMQELRAKLLKELLEVQLEAMRRNTAEVDLAKRSVRELADLDTDVPAIVADLQRSRLTPADYVDFYQALDDVPEFAAQDNAEGQVIAFFEGAEEAEQGVSCLNINPRCTKATTAAPDSGSDATAYRSVGQADFLAALATHGLTWRGFLARMAARGDNFGHMLLRYNAWISANAPISDANPFQSFMADYLAANTQSATVQRQAPLKSAGAGAVMQGIGSLLSVAWDIIKSSRPVVDAASTQNFVLSTDDANPMHYANAKQGASRTVTVSFKSPGVTWAETRFALDGYYNADHQTLPGRWMPQLNFEVFQASAKPSMSLNVRANITSVVNVGTHAVPMPQTEVRVDVTQGSLFNSKLKKVWFRAHGAEGFSVTRQD